MRRRALVGCEMSGEVRDALAATGYWDEVWSADILPTERPARYSAVPEGGMPRVASPQVAVPTGHYQGDVRDLFGWNHPVNRTRQRWAYNRFYGYGEIPGGDWDLWDLAILHPPCDHLSQAGAVWWKHKDATRGGDGRMQDGAAFFMKMVEAPATYVAVENPVGVMGLPNQACFYRRPDQVVEPWWFGDPLAKRTCLWLKDLPLLVADRPVTPTGRVATGGGSWRTDQRSGRGANNGHEDRRGRAYRKIERSRTMPGFARAMAQQWTAWIAGQERAAA